MFNFIGSKRPHNFYCCRSNNLYPPSFLELKYQDNFYCYKRSMKLHTFRCLFGVVRSIPKRWAVLSFMNTLEGSNPPGRRVALPPGRTCWQRHKRWRNRSAHSGLVPYRAEPPKRIVTEGHHLPSHQFSAPEPAREGSILTHRCDFRGDAGVRAAQRGRSPRTFRQSRCRAALREGHAPRRTCAYSRRGARALRPRRRAPRGPAADQG